jgi:hypothetical protein
LRGIDGMFKMKKRERRCMLESMDISTVDGIALLRSGQLNVQRKVLTRSQTLSDKGIALITMEWLGYISLSV